MYTHARALLRAPIGSENPDGSRKFVIRPYTPTSPPDAKGYLDLVRAHAATHVTQRVAKRAPQCPLVKRAPSRVHVLLQPLVKHACGRL